MSSVLKNKYSSQESNYTVKAELHTGEKRRLVDGVGKAGVRPFTWKLQDIEHFVGINRNHKLFKKGEDFNLMPSLYQ